MSLSLVGLSAALSQAVTSAAVSVTINRTGDIVITGDGGDNTVAVTAVEAAADPGQVEVGAFTVSIAGGDTHNLTGVTGGLRVNLKAGDDRLFVVGLPWEYDDWDFAVFEDPARFGGNLLVNTGAGDDWVQLDNVMLGSPGICHGGSQKTTVRTGSSDDRIWISDVALDAEPLVSSGPGDDDVHLAVERDLCGSSSSPTWGGKLRLLTGTGDDTVMVDRTWGTEPVLLDLVTSSGNDSVDIAMVPQHLGRFDGGGGTADVLTVDSLDGHPPPKGFETIIEGP